ncbi:MAG: hypothetical protein EA394_04615 [Bacteroidia bacterium]|nr:MAG: hypothetical protein EA394_04615 [Bacteroidia bacterium]
MEQNALTTFRKLNKVYGAMFFILILLLLLASIMVSNYGPLYQQHPQQTALFKSINIAITALILVLAYAFPQFRIKKMDNTMAIHEKIDAYSRIIRFRLLMIVAAGLITCLFFIMTGDTNLIVVLAIIIIFLILARPTPFKTAADLNLSEDEKNMLLK